MKCKICNQNTQKFKNISLKKEYYHCINCECIFLDELFFVSPTKEKSQYDQHNNSLEDKGYVKMFEDFLDFFWEDIKDTTHLALDFGSGPGPVLETLIQKRDVSCDIYDKFYQPLKIYENKKYDLITSTEVFEHLKNPKETLEFFKNHLNKNGHIALMTLFHSNDKEEFLNWWYPRDPTHITFFTPKTFEVLASSCGLKVVKTDKKRVILLSYM
jgi:hypothetical protein